MHPKFTLGPGLFVTLMTLSVVTLMGSAAAPLGVPLVDQCMAEAEAEILPVTIDVPVNGTVIFGVDELARSSHALAECPEMAAIDASSFVAHAREGGITIIPASRAVTAGGSVVPGGETAQRLVFTPKPGFSGVSEGWEFVIYGQDRSGLSVRIGIVRTTFQVRNTVPVAEDDTVTVASRTGETCVGAADGVLANDVDANGDPIIVHSNGVTSFPWGAVEMHHDGSYRVTVTDPQVSGSEQVRYVVWDQAGSTTGSDVGILNLTFKDDVASAAHGAHHRFLMTPVGGTGDCAQV